MMSCSSYVLADTCTAYMPIGSPQQDWSCHAWYAGHRPAPCDGNRPPVTQARAYGCIASHFLVLPALERLLKPARHLNTTGRPPSGQQVNKQRRSTRQSRSMKSAKKRELLRSRVTLFLRMASRRSTMSHTNVSISDVVRFSREPS